MGKIKISGVIIPNDYQEIYDWIGWDATSPRKVESLLNDMQGDVTVEINSGGGSVYAGSEIYTMLKSHEGNVTIKVTGLAASAASVIAMAGNKTLMSPTAQLMIHNATISTHGDYREMDHTSDFLKNVNQSIVNAYKLKSGLADEDLKEMMDKETWFTAQQALENKLIDEVMFENQMQVAASVGSGLLPQDVINTLKTKLLNDQPTNNKSDFLLAKLNLLKLKGDLKNEL
jgi:ATP-dependent Clp protease, protease subunit